LKQKEFLIAMVVQNIGELLGLAYVIAKFLFPNNGNYSYKTKKNKETN
jgi:hypothetical protein